MPKSNTERQAEHRARKRSAGLVHFQKWVTPAEKQALEHALELVRANKTYAGPVKYALDCFDGD